MAGQTRGEIFPSDFFSFARKWLPSLINSLRSCAEHQRVELTDISGAVEAEGGSRTALLLRYSRGISLAPLVVSQQVHRTRHYTSVYSELEALNCDANTQYECSPCCVGPDMSANNWYWSTITGGSRTYKRKQDTQKNSLISLKKVKLGTQNAWKS